jgi:hypothetical protein
MTIPELAARAYIAYMEARDLGEATPRSFAMLDGRTRDAWCAAAEAIVTAIREDAETQMPKGPLVIMASQENAAAVFRALAEMRGEPDV